MMTVQLTVVRRQFQTVLPADVRYLPEGAHWQAPPAELKACLLAARQPAPLKLLHLEAPLTVGPVASG